MPALAATQLDHRPERCVRLLREWSLACFCNCVGNSPSLALLLDEADVDFQVSGRTPVEREQRTQLLRSWRAMADGGNHGATYARLVVSLAVASIEGADNPVQELRAELGEHLRVVTLPVLSEAQLSEAGRRIAGLYIQAYQLGQNAMQSHDDLIALCLRSLANQATARNPRFFIRMLLEKLDAAYA